MRIKVRLDTVTDIANFVLIASSVKGKVALTNSDRSLITDGKSFLGVAHASEFDSLWCESDEDIYSKIQQFVIEE